MAPRLTNLPRKPKAASTAAARCASPRGRCPLGCCRAILPFFFGLKKKKKGLLFKHKYKHIRSSASPPGPLPLEPADMLGAIKAGPALLRGMLFIICIFKSSNKKRKNEKHRPWPNETVIQRG